jgi:hypothetical protein
MKLSDAQCQAAVECSNFNVEMRERIWSDMIQSIIAFHQNGIRISPSIPCPIKQDMFGLCSINVGDCKVLLSLYLFDM